MVETVSKLRLKYGEIEFEVEGNEALIARERSEFQRTVLPALEVFLSKINTKPVIGVNSTPLLSHDTKNDTKLLTDTIKKEGSYASFAHFLKQKGVNSDIDRVITASYYISEIKGQENFTREDIENEIKNAKQPALSNLSAFINNNIGKGYMEEVDKIEGKRIFRILQPGIEYCENYEPKVQTKKNKNVSNIKRKTTTKQFPILNVTVDDLHMNDKYCDICKLQKFDEQVWVLLHMYTNETEFDTFTRDEIQIVMKQKFKLSSTDSKIRRFFEQAGTNVDKIKRGKEHAIKLLQGGIKKAEEIINNNR